MATMEKIKGNEQSIHKFSFIAMLKDFFILRLKYTE